MPHAHKAVKKLNSMAGWSHCVTPDKCACNPEREKAHGNVIYIDTCSCGATRKSEANGGRTNFGEWIEN